MDGLVQEKRNSIANALELRLSCTNLGGYGGSGGSGMQQGDKIKSRVFLPPDEIKSSVTPGH